MPEFTGHNDIRSYLRILWRWKYLFLTLLVACPAAAYVLARGEPKVYASTALVGINQTTVNTTLLNTAGGFSTSNVTAIAQIVKTTPVAEIASGLMTPRGVPSQIASEVTASGDPSTNFLTISAQDPNPERAAAIANAFAKAIGLNRQQTATSELNASIAGVVAQISRLAVNDPARLPLREQLAQLRSALSAQGNQAAILQAATPNHVPVGPHLRRTVELGLVIGLLLAIGVVVLAEGADRRMRSPDALEGMTDLPLLASIAPSAFSESLETTPVDEESFQILRTSLTYFNVGQALSSVMITSPGEKEGKTTVATRLALVAAKAGLRIVLMDADLRRGGVSARLGLRVQQGLGSVLAGQISVSEAMVELPGTGEEVAGSLMVVPAGPPPPNASALMSSERLQSVLSELEERCDLVIVDTPAALAVSDAVPLMRSVSGVVLVARINQSSRDTVSRLHKIVTSAQGRLLGVVATGVTSAPGYEHYAPSYYAPATGGSRRRPWRRRRRPEAVLDASTPSAEQGGATPSGTSASSAAEQSV